MEVPQQDDGDEQQGRMAAIFLDRGSCPRRVVYFLQGALRHLFKNTNNLLETQSLKGSLARPDWQNLSASF